MAGYLANLLVRIGADVTDFNKSLSKVSRDMKSWSRDLEAIGTQLTLGVTAPLAGLGVAALKVAGDLEQNKVAFETMLKSSDKATAHLEELKKFALSTPFQFPDLVAASKKLQALGFEAGAVIPVLTSVGNASAALGGGAEAIGRVTLAIGQMKAKGAVQAEEMRQLAEAGIPAWEILAKTLNVSVATAMKKVEDRTVSAATAIPALLAGMNEKFGGLMEKQSKTLLGSWANFKDQITFALADIGSALTPIAKRVIEFATGISTAMVGVAQAFSELPGPVKDGTIVILGALAAVGPLSFVLGGLLSSVASLRIAWIAMVNVIPAATLAFSQFGLLVGAQGIGGAITGLSMILMPLAPIILGVAAAIAGVKFGSWISELEITNVKLRNLRDLLFGVDSAASKLSKDAVKGLEFAINGLEKALAKQGVTIDRAGTSTDEYAKMLRFAALHIDDVKKRAAETHKPLSMVVDEMMRGAAPAYDLAAALRKAAGAGADVAKVAQQIKADWAALGFKNTENQIDAMVEAFGRLNKAGKLSYEDIEKASERVYELQEKLRRETEGYAISEDVRALALQRSAAGMQVMTQAILDQLSASQPWGKKLEYDTAQLDAFAAAAYRASLGLKEAATQQLDVDWTKASTGTSLETITRPGSSVDLRRAADAAAGEAQRVRDMWQEGKAAQSDYEEAQRKAIEAERKATGQVVVHTQKVNEFGREVVKAYDHMRKGIADSIVEWKGFGETALSVVKELAKGITEILIGKALKALGSALLDNIDKTKGLGKVLGDLFGIGSGAASTGLSASKTAGSVSSAGGVASAASSGVAGVVTAVASVGTMISSIVGNFQFAGMNKSLDIIVKHTLQTANDLANLRADSWARETHLMLKLDDIWATLIRIADRGLTATVNAATGGGGTFYFQHCTFGAGLTQSGVDGMMRSAYERARLAAG